MILSFADKAMNDIFHGRDTKAARRIPRELWERIQVKLDSMNAATALLDLRSPPSNRLEALRGNFRGFYSIRVNDQYRLVFRFAGGSCSEVRCMDYH